MEPIVEKITLVEDARFDSPKSMFMGRVMGKCLKYMLMRTSSHMFIVLQKCIIPERNVKM